MTARLKGGKSETAGLFNGNGVNNTSNNCSSSRHVLIRLQESDREEWLDFTRGRSAMILENRKGKNSSMPAPKYDVCIVGAGAAGITLATELSEAGFLVALCEGGGREFSAESQDCYKGTVSGDPYHELDVVRLRYLGGSTNHWAGLCRSFEELDFNRGYMGEEYYWPIQYGDLLAYRDRASRILEIANSFTDTNFSDSAPVKKIEFKSSPRVRFGRKFIDQMERSEQLHLYLNANLVGISGSRGRIKSVTFATFQKQTFGIEAKKLIFAMGGIENSRFMLWFGKQYGNKFFSNDTPIGKYWMEHPHFTLGEALVESSISENRFWSIKEEIQRQEKILSCGFRLDIQHDQGLRRLVRDLLCTAPSLGQKMAALADRELLCGIKLRAAWEQAPSFDNAIALSTQEDHFGVPRVVLNWRKSSLDRKTIKTSTAVFNDWLMTSDFGRLKLSTWLMNDRQYPTNDELGGPHHMGGTRMSHNPRYGVVDGNCKVFGSENLYIAGSSIFTTGGHNNPTLPIVQFSLRLAGHIKTIL